ncbi:hypothetical protein KLM65_18365 [Clostridioides difficile]|nr:hypothetical protein [Clostridioides difficile]
MNIKNEAFKLIGAGAKKAVKKVGRDMVQLPALNWHYQLVNNTSNIISSGLHKALSTPANLKNEATEAIYEARKNKNVEDISYNNTTPYSINQMLEDAQVQSNTHLYQARANSNNIAEQFAKIEQANRNLHKFKS